MYEIYLNSASFATRFEMPWTEHQEQGIKKKKKNKEYS